MTVKELRLKLRKLTPYREELEIGNRIIIKTANGYGVRGINDRNDPMTDYCAYIFGYKEKWIIEEAIQKGLIKE